MRRRRCSAGRGLGKVGPRTGRGRVSIRVTLNDRLAVSRNPEFPSVAAVVYRHRDQVGLPSAHAPYHADVLRRRRLAVRRNCLCGRGALVGVPRPLRPVHILSRALVVTCDTCSPSVKTSQIVSALSVIGNDRAGRGCTGLHTYNCCCGCTAFDVSVLYVRLQVPLRQVSPSAAVVAVARAAVGAHVDGAEADRLDPGDLVSAPLALVGLRGGAVEAEDVFAGNHPAVDEDGLEAGVATVDHGVDDLKDKSVFFPNVSPSFFLMNGKSEETRLF